MITRLEAENFKRLTAVQITPDGSAMVVVGGKNGAGKTSTLDAIEAALGGKARVPGEPIKKGAKKARVVVETADLVVTRVFTPKGSRLEVKAKDGSVIRSPQGVLDALMGDLSFDPLAFGRMKPQRQVEVLRKLAGCDFTDLDERRKGYEQERRDVGRDKKRAEGALASLPEAPDAPAMSASEILAEIEARKQRNDDRNSRRQLLEELRGRAAGLAETLKQRRQRVEELEEELRQVRADVDDTKNGLEELRAKGKPLAAEVENLPPDEPIDELKAQLADAEKHAAAAAEAGRREELTAEVAAAAAQYDELTAKIEQLDEVRLEAIETAKYPIKGLEAHDEGVYLGGVPWQQASSAEALRASVAIGLALNPELRVLLIRDGSLLDEDSLRMISDMATEAEAQLWIEKVSTGDVCSVIIEDGRVRDEQA